jgi:hypothetical protein
MELHEEIMELLRKRARSEHQYVNPNFLQRLTCALSEYYGLEDDEVDTWVMDMFGA